MAVKASATITLSWQSDIVAVTKYYQLTAATASQPSVPTSTSNLGNWTETEPDVDTTKVLWSCECTILNTGEEIWSSVSKSTSYEAAKGAYSLANTKVSTTTFKELKDTVDEQSSTITTLTTKTDTLQKWQDGFEVGGRNYALSSSEDRAATRSSNNVFCAYDLSDAFRALTDDVSAFVISFDAKADDGATVKLDAYLRSSSASVSSPMSWAVTPGASWARYYKAVTRGSSASNADALYVYVRSYGGAGTFYVRNVKVEKGTIPTDWTPAPEDMATESSVTTLSNTVNSVKQTANSNSASITTLTTTTSDLSTRMTSAESSIKQNQSSIELKVSKTEFNNLKLGGRNYLKNTTSPLSVTSTGGTNVCGANYYLVNGAETYKGVLSGKQVIFSADFAFAHAEDSTDTSGSFYVQFGSPYYASLTSTYKISDVGDGIHITGKVLTCAVYNSEDESPKYANHLYVRTDGMTGTLTISNAKLELGNKATDWSPAPEDIATVANLANLSDELNGSIESANQAASNAQEAASKTQKALEDNVKDFTEKFGEYSSIQMAVDSVKTSVSKTYIKSDGTYEDEDGNSINAIDALIGQNTTVQQTSAGLDILTTTVQGEDGGSGLVGRVNTIESGIKITTETTTDSDGNSVTQPVVTLGTTDSPFKTRVTNEKMSFMDGESEVAYVSGNMFYMVNGIVTDELKIGNWVWYCRDNDDEDLTVKWVG